MERKGEKRNGRGKVLVISQRRSRQDYREENRSGLWSTWGGKEEEREEGEQKNQTRSLRLRGVDLDRRDPSVL